eukprot:CAMPEP_0114416698 /NCGR_PEP_ID=MMETSP0103-20121206/2566_1 /TAXON_ID=37642 ORGANISM="Paraphysomonas imperforata, Strain PA2" /NCGR_SAMPLE_ID=MMETSP0103 /ASSEMBLY_ACC=CAM_ASM_000201 /LENGTH=348 /DNA_ID=CAMNT_0001584935 /DNA_START=1106 /DNA_END=2152 /DNA_ORIENTATION=+
MSAQFGVHAWHWHVTQGLPTVLGLYCIPFVVAAWRALMSLRRSYINSSMGLFSGVFGVWTSEEALLAFALLTVALYIICMSLSPHKEFRFLLPCLPSMHWWLAKVVHASCQRKDSVHSNPIKKVRMSRGVLWLHVVVAVHVGGAVYLCTQHQAGTEHAFHSLHERIMQGVFSPSAVCSFSQDSSTSCGIASHDVSVWQTDENVNGDREVAIYVHLLAPCYSFPGLSFLAPLPPLTTVSLFSPTCSPEITSSELSESALFEQSPLNFWNSKTHSHSPGRERVNTSSPWPAPDVVMTFDGYLTGELVTALAERDLIEVGRFHHAHFKYDMDDPVSKRAVVTYFREGAVRS